MPPRRRGVGKAAAQVASIKPGAPKVGKKAPPKARGKGTGAHKMPPPLPPGEILQDFHKRKWTLGTSVGKGGFGEIYLAAPQGTKLSPSTAEHVIKIEPHANGPLFTELSFYTRIAKPEKIREWSMEHKLPFLSVPEFVAAGSHLHDGGEYRFMVMQRFGMDIEKLFTAAGRRFGLKTVCYLALRLLEALEFLHTSEYVHADIKGSNLLTGHCHGREHEVHLVDYGLAYRFHPEGHHKEYKEDPRRAHDGTIKFTSIDAHKGVCPSRRGDLEILGYCLLQWACGRLPWEDNLADKPYVACQKIKYKSDVEGLMQACFVDSGPAPTSLKEYMKYVYGLGYQDQPDYGKLKQLFLTELKARKMKDDKKGLDWLPSRKRKSSEEMGGLSPSKRKRVVVVSPPEEGEGEESPAHITPAGRKEGAVRRRGERSRASPAVQKRRKKQLGSPAKEVEEEEGSDSDKDGGKQPRPTKRKKASPKGRPHVQRKKEPIVEESTDSNGGALILAPMMTRHSPRQLIPHVSYPPALGYTNGEGTGGWGSRGGRGGKRKAAPQRRRQRQPEGEERENEEEENEDVPVKRKHTGGRRRNPNTADSDSDEDFVPPKRRARRRAAEPIVLSD